MIQYGIQLKIKMLNTFRIITFIQILKVYKIFFFTIYK